MVNNFSTSHIGSKKKKSYKNTQTIFYFPTLNFFHDNIVCTKVPNPHSPPKTYFYTTCYFQTPPSPLLLWCFYFTPLLVINFCHIGRMLAWYIENFIHSFLFTPSPGSFNLWHSILPNLSYIPCLWCYMYLFWYSLYVSPLTLSHASLSLQSCFIIHKTTAEGEQLSL